MKILSSKSKQILSKLTFIAFKHQIEEMLEEKDELVIALCGGRSIPEFYVELGKNFSDLPYDKLQFFLLDERVEELKRNSDLIKEYILHPALANASDDEQTEIMSRFHFMDVILDKHKDFAEVIMRYNELLERFSPDLSFDIIIASSGLDSHVGAIYPEHDLIYSKQAGFGHLFDAPTPPLDRITLLPKSFINSKKAFLFFIDKEKKKSYDVFMNSEGDYYECPSLMLKKEGNYIVTNIIK